MATSKLSLKASKDHSKLTTFSATVNSAITDANVGLNEGRYFPSLNMAMYTLRLSSNSGKIPTANGTIVTIPSQYCPVATVNTYAIVIPTTSSAYSDLRTEGIYLTPEGKLCLNNYIYGATATKLVIVHMVYFCK